MTTNYAIEQEYITVGPIAATASPDGQMVAIDFANHLDTSKALRLGVPESQLQNLIAALVQIQKALADPASGIRLSTPH